MRQYLERPRYERGDATLGYRNGYLPERKITLGSGSISLKKMPRVSDEPEGKSFESKIVTPYQKRSASVSELFPKLFIEGLATRDFEQALRSLMGESTALSPSTISRLNQKFKVEYDEWRGRSLSDTKIVYIYADGIYVAAGIADEIACLLVVIGVDQSGVKHFLVLEEGYRESTDSWKAVLRDLRDRGMNTPALAIGDGALGFWAAMSGIFPMSKQQLCWLHKTRNILDKLPKKEHAEAVQRLRAIQRASGRTAAEKLANPSMALINSKGISRIVPRSFLL